MLLLLLLSCPPASAVPVVSPSFVLFVFPPMVVVTAIQWPINRTGLACVAFACLPFRVHLRCGARAPGGGSFCAFFIGAARNCVARLWWSRRAGENAEFMTWEAFENAFQGDVSASIWCGSAWLRLVRLD